jgi:hypothetical protein
VVKRLWNWVNCLMSIDRHLQEKIYRLETLRKYQAYYGPNTPHQIIAEINQLEVELRRMLKADVTRPTPPAVRPAPKKTDPNRKRSKSGSKKKVSATPEKGTAGWWALSQSTTDLIATIAFIGLVFLLGAIVFAAYVQTRPANRAGLAQASTLKDAAVVLRPTFTPTANAGDQNSVEQPATTVDGTMSDTLLPPAHKEPTSLPTPVPTLTPTAIPDPTDTPTPVPTNTPVPTKPPPPPPPTSTPAPPTPTPAPTFPFQVSEQGNRMFQGTSYHVINIYVAIVSQDNIPLGGYKVVADHVPSGAHVESGLSTWDWSVTNCLDCDYIKFGNVKIEPGTFSDGTWSIYVADESGTQLSQPVPLSYASDPAQWVWDFIIFRKAG